MERLSIFITFFILLVWSSSFKNGVKREPVQLLDTILRGGRVLKFGGVRLLSTLLNVDRLD